MDKPAGWTSFDVVNYIRKMVAQAEGKKPKSVKVGHAGTLDPFATGLLIILVGKEYTRQAAKFSKLDKTYEVTMKLSFTSSTGDPEGEITAGSDHKPSQEELGKALQKFQGEIMQTPPAFSAIKVNGQRAYKLARAGKEVKLEPRKTSVYSLRTTDYAYPVVQFTADVSSGTYIRSLVEDIGKILETGAYTTDLKRTKIGRFDLKNASDIQKLKVNEMFLTQIQKEQ